jgi:N-methylhydantoinase B/oxoprolinase/acetone carboxylase alpha subunit
MAGGQAGQIGTIFVQHIDNKREKLGNTATVEMQVR